LITLYSPGLQTHLAALKQIHQGLLKLKLSNVSVTKVQQLLWLSVWRAWRTNGSSRIVVSDILASLVTEMSRQFNLDQSLIVSELQRIQDTLPKHCLEPLFDSVKKTSKRNTEVSTKTSNYIMHSKQIDKKEQTRTSFSEQLMTQPVVVNNAGIVVLQSYINMYFKRLGIVKEDQFISPQAQRESVHYLQYLVTGAQETEEQYLTLNKVLSNLAVNEAIESGITMNSEQKTLADGLLQAVIDQWPSSGASSLDGLRGNWLVREGLLRETAEHWELTIEKRPYDVLLERCPFSYHLIKLPWMKKALYVNWAS
jgi:hypothetical protein